jgi:hypothetical protein
VTTKATQQAERDGLAEDRLVGVEAIAQFIDPNLSLWKAQRLLEEKIYPSWKEGRVYVASRRALREHWERMTGVRQHAQSADAEAA